MRTALEVSNDLKELLRLSGIKVECMTQMQTNGDFKAWVRFKDRAGNDYEVEESGWDESYAMLRANLKTVNIIQGNIELFERRLDL